jgi:hypothetical protein
MVGGTRIHRSIHERALVEVQEKERKKIHTSEEKKRTFAARDLEVSLDRADAFIEGGRDDQLPSGRLLVTHKSKQCGGCPRFAF